MIPTLVANAAFLPRHLLPGVSMVHEAIPQLETVSASAEFSNGLGDE